jgi:D-alanyl-D-alanine carboxypeptidase
MKRALIVSTILVVIIVAGLLIVLFGGSTRSLDNLDKEMEYLVSDLVKNDKSVKSCVLSVMKGDGSFSWSGAAGIASQDSQVPMTKDTPIYIASITKLYTATAIMRLYEKGALSLTDPMSKYLPQELIQGIHVYKGKDYSREITIKELFQA